MPMPERWELDGPPSSLSVLVQWLVRPGNFRRYINRTQPLRELLHEIYVALSRRGITYRTPRSIHHKLVRTIEQFGQARAWLERVRGGKVGASRTGSVQRELLRSCPAYLDLEPVLGNAPTLVPKRHQADHAEDSEVRLETTHAVQTRDSTAGKKKKPLRSSTRDERRQQVLVGWAQGSDKADMARFPLLGANEHECREFFKLELQVKRDQAICVRAKARKELGDLGMPRREVDRLLPL